MNKKNFYFIFLTLYTLSTKNIKSSESITQDNQKDSYNQQFVPAKFFKQLKYTQSSIKCFLKHIYNHQYYADKFLALNFDHVIDFLSHIEKTTEPRAYIKSILKLFGQKLKATPYINSFAFLSLLEKLILLSPYFEQDSITSEIETQKIIKKYLIDLLEANDSTNAYLDETKNKIYNLFKIEKNNKKFLTDLQYVMDQFLEISLSKLIWSYFDQESCWESVKLIACQLEQMEQKNFITTEMLNELYWTILSRFKYFLNLSGRELNEGVYNAINADLENDSLQLWALTEREPFILSKREFLQQAVINNSISARAYKQGLISNYIS